MQMKHCHKCGRDMPATKDFFYRDTRYKEPFRSPCKECCRNTSRERKAEYNKEYSYLHHDELIEYHRKYNIEHKEQRRKYKHENREYLTNWHREYVLSNHDRVRQVNRQWEINNKEKRNMQARIHDAKRRAAKRNSNGSYTKYDVDMQYKRQKGKCFWCNKKVLNNFHIDHVIPLLRGGSNDSSNIVISCPTCNMKKSCKLPHEWEGSNRLL